MTYTTPHTHPITLCDPPTCFHSPAFFHRPTTTHESSFGVKTKQRREWRKFQLGRHLGGAPALLFRAPALSPLSPINCHLLPPSPSHKHFRKPTHISVLGFHRRSSSSEVRRGVEGKRRVKVSLIVLE